jgi:hypothetical protein
VAEPGSLSATDYAELLREAVSDVRLFEASQQLLDESDWYLYVDGASARFPEAARRRGRPMMHPLVLAKAAAVQAELACEACEADMDTHRADRLVMHPDAARRRVMRACSSLVADDAG